MFKIVKSLRVMNITVISLLFLTVCSFIIIVYCYKEEKEEFMCLSRAYIYNDDEKGYYGLNALNCGNFEKKDECNKLNHLCIFKDIDEKKLEGNSPEILEDIEKTFVEACIKPSPYVDLDYNCMQRNKIQGFESYYCATGTTSTDSSSEKNEKKSTNLRSRNKKETDVKTPATTTTTATIIKGRGKKEYVKTNKLEECIVKPSSPMFVLDEYCVQNMIMI